jgi:hypothetical protein
LLFGDIVNGKAGIVDLVQDEFSDSGFTGIAYVEDEEVYPLTGVYASYNQKLEYTYDIQGDYEETVLESFEHGEVEEMESKINGEVLKYYIQQADLSFKMDSNDDEILLPEYYPAVMLIRGTSLSQWDSFKTRNLSLTLSTVLVELFFMIGTFVLLYRPIHKFALYMETQVSIPKSNKVLTKVKAVATGHGSSNNGSTHQNTRIESL